jgi:hypothetical protein
MSFPTSPINGQTTVTNNITYSYNSTIGAWTRVAGLVTATTSLLITNTTGASSTATGALQVAGGAGIVGGLFVGGTVTATSFVGSFSGTTTQANNLNNGTAGQLAYQSAPNVTAFAGPGTAGQILVSNGAAAPVYTNTASIQVGFAVTAGQLLAANTSSQYVGFAGRADAINPANTGTQYVAFAGRADAINPLNTGTQYVAFAGRADAINPANTGTQYVGFAGRADAINPANTGSQTVGFAANLLSGTAGGLPYQSAANTTQFVTPGTAGQVLVSAGTSAPQWTSLSTLSASTATNLASGTAGQVPYQTGAGATSFFGPGTAGQILVSNGAAAPVYTNTSSIQVGFAVTAGQLLAANTGSQYVGFAGRADAINPANTGTQYVGYSNQSNNILGGTAGDLLYQSAASTTAKLTVSATAGALLASSGTNPQYVTQVKAITGGTGSASAATGQTLVVTANGLGVTGDSYFANNVGVNGNVSILSVNANTQTATSNSLYVAGGAWVDRGLIVNGDTTFVGNVTFSGTTTNILSTNTYYTDNVIELHTPPSGVNGTWITNDGKDIGFRFHWYDTADKNAALVMANDTRALEWYQTGAEGTFPNGTITGGVYGTFKTGKIVLAGTSTPSGTTSETTGDLQVAGGVGIGGGLYVKNVVTASSLILGNALGVPSGGTGLTTLASGSIPYGNGTGALNSLSITGSNGQILSSNGSAPVWTSFSNLTAGNATTATNLAGGTAGQISYQTAPGLTGFAGPGTAGQILVSNGAAAPVYTNTSSIQVGFAVTAGQLLAANTGTQYVGFAGRADAINPLNTGTQYVAFAGRADAINPLNTGTQYVAFAGRADAINPANTSSIAVGFAVTAGQLLAANTGTQYVGFAGRADAINPANTGTQYVAFAGRADAINPANTGTQYVGNANQANNIIGGTAGQLHYQSGANVTAFVAAGTAGQLLSSNGAAAPSYVNTSTLAVGFAATAGQLLAANTGSQYVGYSNQSNNVAGGLANQIPYQTAPGTTAFSAGLTYNGTTLTATNQVVSGTSNSTGYNNGTGALQVAGGAAINNDLWVGGNINLQGSLFLKGVGLDQITSTTGTFVNILVTGTNATNSTITGALVVSGGVGIGGGLSVYGTVTATSFVGSFSGTTTQANNLNNGTAGQLVYQSAPNVTAFAGPGTAGQLLVSGGTGAPTYTNTSSIQVGFAASAGQLLATSTGTTYVGFANQSNNLFGASGQIPYQSALNTTAFSANLAYDGTTLAAGNVKATGTTDATSTNTGALQVVGGVGIGKNLFVGGTAYFAGDLYVDGTQFVVNTQAVATGDKALVLSTGSTTAALAASAGLYIGASSGTAYTSFTYDGVGSWVIPTGAASGGLKIQGTTAAGVNTAAAGALQVSGGVGIAGGLYVGGTVTATTFVGSFSGTTTQANNLNNGTAGQLVYQSAPGVTAFAGPGTAGQILQSGGTGAPAYTTTSSVGVGFSANLFSGAAGSLPYQTGANATAFLAGGSQGQFLRYGSGNAPIWSSTGTFSGGVASTSSVVSQSVTVSGGGVGVVGDSYVNGQLAVSGVLYAGNIATAGTVVGGGVRSTTSANPPASPTVGDIWYATGTDDIYRYTTDGSSSFWLDINGPAVASSTAGLVSLATLKATVAASTSFADFQTRIAAL